MAVKHRRFVREIATPIRAREPLFVRLCTGFVDNLAMLLRTAFILGAFFLAQDLRTLYEKAAEPVAELDPAPTLAATPGAIDVVEDPEPVLSEGVIHALNCTFQDYRNAHYDECVKEPSSVYPRPGADPDDTGLVFYEAPILYASR